MKGVWKAKDTKGAVIINGRGGQWKKGGRKIVFLNL